MTPPADLAALRDLVEAVLTSQIREPRLPHETGCGCADSAHREGWDDGRARELAAWEVSLGPMAITARETLERLEENAAKAQEHRDTGPHDGCVCHWCQPNLKASLASLEGALVRYGRHESGCPEDLTGTVVLKSEFRQRPCSCGFTAALAGRDE